MKSNASAQWEGSPKDGTGTISTATGVLKNSLYSSKARFEGGTSQTTPEELIAAAHAGCYSMALSFELERAGHAPKRVRTKAAVHFGKVGEGFAITEIDLVTEAEVPGIERAKFLQIAEGAKKGCPVSKALAGTTIKLKAALV